MHSMRFTGWPHKSTEDHGVEPADESIAAGMEAQELQPREPAGVLGELARDAKSHLEETHDRIVVGAEELLSVLPVGRGRALVPPC